MANCCFTEVVIKHEDREKLKELSEKIIEWEKPYKGCTEANNWLGNIVANSGIESDIHMISDSVCGKTRIYPKLQTRCRGELCDIAYDEENGEIVLSTDTAWEPMLQMWVRICEKFAPGAQLLYTAEELSNGLLATNDPDYENCWFFDPYDYRDLVSDYCMTEDALVEVMRDLLGRKDGTLDDLSGDFDDRFGEQIGLHKWSMVPISAWG